MSLQKFVVSVLPDGCGRGKRYTVMASTELDAVQLAFALDGGWGPDRDATEMLPVAQSYASVVKSTKTRRNEVRARQP